MCKFSPTHYDAAAKTIKFRQKKTNAWVVLHVPRLVSDTFDAMAGRLPDRLLVTPRGVAWNTTNVRETQQSLCQRLGQGRYVVHGLRATGPTALKMLGFENRAIRALTGHASDAQLEVYLRGVANHELAREAQEALGERFAATIDSALEGANTKSFSGRTGRSAAAARRSAGEMPTAKHVPNAKPTGANDGKGQ